MLRWIATIAALCSLGSARALTVSSESPGNVFVAGKPLKFTLEGASSDVACALYDYWGEKREETFLDAGDTHLVLPGQPPGYYELHYTDDEGTALASLGVVIDQGDEALPTDGRVGIDTAIAWCIDEDLWATAARMLRRAGIPWVRERISWWGVEGEPGKFDWEHYPAAADVLHAQGIHISQVFDCTPGWTYQGQVMKRPEDLRAVYRATRAAASQFRGQIGAWELWNEPDLGFDGLADSYAGVLKAGYWGVKDGSPKALVLQGSFNHWVLPFVLNLAECGAGDYFDVLNVHRYHSPYGYEPALRDHLGVWRRNGQPDRPVWITETNILLWLQRDTDEQLLSPGEQQRACRYVPQAVALSLAAGTQRHFFFILGNRREGDVQFGFLRPEFTPYPSFVALSAAANILGTATYLGRLPAPGARDCLAFATPRGNVLVAWADSEAHLTLPTERCSVRVADLFGAQERVRAERGQVTVSVGPEAVYVIDVGERIWETLSETNAAEERRPTLRPSRVVVVGQCDLPIEKRRNWYVVSGVEPIEFKVDAYNFDEEIPTRGRVEVLPPAGWRVEGGRRGMRLEPMGREGFTCRLWPTGDALGPEKVQVRGEFRGVQVAPSVSHFGRDPAAIRPARRMPLDLSDPAGWTAAVVEGNAETAITRRGRTGIRAKTRYGPGASRHATLSATFESPADFSAFDGICVDCSHRPATSELAVRLALKDREGSCWWMSGATLADQPRKLFLFRDLIWHWQSTPNSRLDMRHIIELRLEYNLPSDTDALTVEVGELDAVKFD